MMLEGFYYWWQWWAESGTANLNNFPCGRQLGQEAGLAESALHWSRNAAGATAS